MASDPRELLDSLPELVLVVDEDGIVRDGNATVTAVAVSVCGVPVASTAPVRVLVMVT